MSISSSRQIGHLVRIQRKKMGLTQKQLANAAGVSERLISALELGDAPGIQLDKLLKILSIVDLELLALPKENCPSEDPNARNASSLDSSKCTFYVDESIKQTRDDAYAEGFSYMLSLIDDASNAKRNSHA